MAGKIAEAEAAVVVGWTYQPIEVDLEKPPHGRLSPFISIGSRSDVSRLATGQAT